MAKVQSFADKVKKKSAQETNKVVRLVYSYKAAESGTWRFADKLVKIAPGDSEDQAIKSEITRGKARLEKN